MNYLAHLFLAGDDPDKRLGGLIADFTRGRLDTLARRYPRGVMVGIAIHRQIDCFTDRHCQVAQSKGRFSRVRRRYAGIIVDVLYDHFLSRHWSRYSDTDRNVFITEAYQMLERNHHSLPERLQRIAPLMIEQDWLGGYHHIEQLGDVYDRMSIRLRRPNSLAGAVDEVKEHYLLLEQDFKRFFPEILAHVNSFNRDNERHLYSTGTATEGIMNGKPKTQKMALFCDFENVALGVQDAKYAAFDVQKVLERLLLKGNIVVKKAYCDWDRYKEFKAAMHEAAFELIEIPHLRQSGKNSADIRMVVDALDLCYTKSHVDTFVIISGDSDFSPLVSKLRENNKLVIGVGVKNSTSDLLTSNCDEFIYYDDLVRESEKQRKKQKKKAVKKTTRKTAEQIEEEKQQVALDLLLETVEDLFEERGEEEKVWGSMVKQALKRRKPGFSETYHGFRTFGKLLEEAQTRKLLQLEYDEKSGGYIIRSFVHEE